MSMCSVYNLEANQFREDMLMGFIYTCYTGARLESESRNEEVVGWDGMMKNEEETLMV